MTLQTLTGRLRRWSAMALAVGAAAGAVCAAGVWLDPARLFPAYLVAYLFWLGISLGSLAILMLHHLTGGGWGWPIRRILEAACANLLIMAILFVPLGLSAETLYVWARPEAVAGDALLQRKSAYLNVPAWQIRAGVYFTVWIVLGLALNRWAASDAPHAPRSRQRRLVRLAGPGLILWALTVTFASIDWVMSLEPHWYSSMFGLLFMGAQGVSALSLAIVVVAVLRDEPPWQATLDASRSGDLGSLLLAFVMFWSYVSLMQFLIIWSGNLPEETPWYLSRSRGGWQVVAVLLAGLHFVVPFLLLLVRRVKRDARRLAGVAILLLAMRLMDLSWLVLPAFSPGRVTFNGWLIVTPLAIGGLWLAAFSWHLATRARLGLVPASFHEGNHGDLAGQRT